MVNLGPKRPPSRKGTMEDLPDEIRLLIEQYEDLLTVTATQLKKISDHFRDELEKGLSVEGGNIPMNVAWVMDYPTGSESGTYLALDMGGTNLRIAEVTLNGKRGFDVTQSKYRMPDEMKDASADELWNYIAKCVGDFLHQRHHEDETVYIGFTFSYPCTQHAINHGELQRWTKGFNIDGVEGHDVVPMVHEAFKRHGVNAIIGALINDTTGTLVASNYVDSNTHMGCIFGTGCNAAYYEKVANIPKIQGKLSDDIPQDSWMAINCEYGAFDNEHVSLPRTKYDEILDRDSPRPGQQAFEKMIAGYTLGEIMRLILIENFDAGKLFKGQDASLLRKPFSLDAEFLSQIEEDPFENLENTHDLFIAKINLKLSVPELILVRRLAELIGTRAARLSMCGIAAMSKKTGRTTFNAGADGSVFTKYPHFKERGAKALADIFDWKMDPKDYPIKVVAAEDGSGVGAAIIAALTKERLLKGLSVGELGYS